MNRADPRSQCRRRNSGATPQIRHHPPGLKQSQQALRGQRRSKELLSEFSPLTPDLPEEPAAVDSTLGNHLCGPPGIFAALRIDGAVATGEFPEFAGHAIQIRGGTPVHGSRAFAPPDHPARLEQTLQMPRHRRLRQLQRTGQLTDAELLRVEQAQQPHPRRIGEGIEPVQQWSRRVGCRHAGSFGIARVGPGTSPWARRRSCTTGLVGSIVYAVRR